MQVQQTQDNESLPFTPDKQRALVGHAFANELFFRQAMERVESRWFQYPNTQKVWGCMQDFYKAYNRKPKSVEELSDSSFFMKYSNTERIQLKGELENCLQQMPKHGIDLLVPELDEWLKTMTFVQGLKNVGKLWQAKKHKEAYDIASNTVREISTIALNQHIEERFDNFFNEFEAIEQVHSNNLCTTGLPLFDRLILPEANGDGCFQPGDVTLFLAGTNVGKTSTLITLLVNNILHGKNVLLLTHEGRPIDIKQKIWSCLLNKNKKEILNLYKQPSDPLQPFSMLWGLKLLNERLTYIPLNKAGLTVEEVAEIVRKQQELRIARTGKGYDLIIDDYPAKLTTVLASKGNMARRHIDDITYNMFVQLALELNLHVIAAIQANREGNKANRNADKKNGQSLLFMENAMEAWGPMTTASTVISINRDEYSAANNLVTYLICKSRSSETGYAVVCRSDYGKAKTFDKTLGCTYYRSSLNYAQNLDQWLNDFNGGEVPENRIIAASIT